MPPDASPGDDERLKIARALSSNETVGLINEDNKVVGWSDLANAIAGDECFFIRDVRANILVCDFDKVASERESEEVFLELRLAGHRPILVASGGRVEGEERRHVLAAFSNPSERDTWAKDVKAGWPLCAVLHSVRPPGTLHKLRVERSTPQIPSDLSEVTARLAKPSASMPLSKDHLHAIREGAGKGVDRSVFFYRVAGALRFRGWTLEEALLLLQHPKFGISKTFEEARAKHGSAIDWFTRYVWPQAGPSGSASGCEFMAAARRFRTHMLLRILLREEDLRSRFTDIKVMEVFIQLCERYGRDAVSVSYRQLLELANIGSPETLADSIFRLRDAGLIRRDLDPPPSVAGTPSAELAMARAYRLPILDAELADSPETTPLTHLLGVTFRYGTGYGPTAGLLYEVVLRTEAPATVQGLAEALGLSSQTVARQVAALTRAGLLSREGVVVTPTGVAPEALALELATRAAAYAITRHDLEREGYGEHRRRIASTARRGPA